MVAHAVDDATVISPIFGEPPASAEPCESPLDGPSAGEDVEALGLVGTFDAFAS